MASFKNLAALLVTGALAAPTTPANTFLEKRCCPTGLKNVVFNGGYRPEQFAQITGASNYVTFGLGSNPGQIPMMAFEEHVAEAVSIVNSDAAPEFMLTFNEPDFSYMGWTPTMDPQTAANAIQPLLQNPGTKTKFIAPALAFTETDWLEQFFAACGCQNFFHAYNMHVYIPNLEDAKNNMINFHNRFADKPLWVTEIAPGNANCGLDFPAVTDYMNGLYSWGASTGWMEKIFWNTGNEIPDDTNVCDSYLLDAGGNPSPLLDAFAAVEC